MKKFICKVMVMLSISIMLVANVSARSVIEAGDDVNVEGNFNSSSFVFGNTVTTNAQVDGISVVAGNIVTGKGTVSYGFYAGNTLTIDSTIEKDLFVAGNMINISSDSLIGRDVYVAGNQIKINTNIPGNLRIVGSSVDLSGVTISGNAYIAAEELTLDKNTVIVGKLSYNEDASVSGKSDATIGSVETRDSLETEVQVGPLDKVKSTLMSVISGFMVMVVLCYIAPKTKEKLEKVELRDKNIIKNAGMGLLMLIAVPFVSLIAITTIFGMALGVIVLIAYGMAIYLSSLVVGYVVGREVAVKVFKNENMYVSLIIGIALIKLLSILPVIGGLIGFISMIYGLDLIYQITLKKEN